MDESACIKLLDDWIKSKKEPIYEQNFKSPENAPDSLVNYKRELMNLCNSLRKAIWSNTTADLEKLGWPYELIECSKNANMRLEMCDRLKQWLITFPNVKNAKHLDNLIVEE